jgi:hypothetical protein
MTIDRKIVQCRMCDRRKINIVVSSLTSCALTWWDNLCVSERYENTYEGKALST